MPIYKINSIVSPFHFKFINNTLKISLQSHIKIFLEGTF